MFDEDLSLEILAVLKALGKNMSDDKLDIPGFSGEITGSFSKERVLALLYAF